MSQTNADLVLVARAADFAARVHVDQHRKGIAQEPYVNHLAEVACLLAEATEGADGALVAAGYLHDTLEDTPTSFEELASLFGEDVARLVAEVTDDKALDKDERKRRQIASMATKSPRAQLIKFADKTSNIGALVTSPPAGWSRERMLDYVAWGEEVIGRATTTNAILASRFASTVSNARHVIAEQLA